MTRATVIRVVAGMVCASVVADCGGGASASLRENVERAVRDDARGGPANVVGLACAPHGSVWRCHVRLRTGSAEVQVIVRGGLVEGTYFNQSVAPDPSTASPSLSRARACLSAAGFHVLGGAAPHADPGGPTGELIVSGTFIAYYASEAVAARAEPDLLKRAASLHGYVMRHGNGRSFT